MTFLTHRLNSKYFKRKKGATQRKPEQDAKGQEQKKKKHIVVKAKLELGFNKESARVRNTKKIIVKSTRMADPGGASRSG